MNPVFGTTYLRTMPIDLERCFPVKAAVRPFGIIEFSVFFYHLLCLRNILEEISVKAFISELAVEAFKVAVLPGAGLFNKFMAYAFFLQELPESSTSEFRTLIGSDDSGCAEAPDTFFQDFHSPFRGNTEPAVNAGRKSAEEVFHSHEFDRPAVHKIIKKEIHCPNMIRISGFGQRRLDYREFFILAGPVSLQVEASIDSVEFLVINVQTARINNMKNPSVAVEGVFVVRSFF